MGRFWGPGGLFGALVILDGLGILGVPMDPIGGKQETILSVKGFYLELPAFDCLELFPGVPLELFQVTLR